MRDRTVSRCARAARPLARAGCPGRVALACDDKLVALVVERPRRKLGQKALPQQRRAPAPSDARCHIRDGMTTYRQFAQDDDLLRDRRAVSDAIGPGAAVIAAIELAGARQRLDRGLRERYVARSSVENEVDRHGPIDAPGYAVRSAFLLKLDRLGRRRTQRQQQGETEREPACRPVAAGYLLHSLPRILHWP